MNAKTETAQHTPGPKETWVQLLYKCDCFPTTLGHNSKCFIVRAVNSHEELLEALKEMRVRYDRLEKLYAEKAGIEYDTPNGTIERADKAIAEAEKGA